MAEGKALFLDTSIQIARVIHSPAKRQLIEARIAKYRVDDSIVATSAVVKQEYKRRYLKEALYLLDLLNDYKSFQEVYYHVERLQKSHERKRHINLQLLGIETLFGHDDAEKTVRLRLYLRDMLTFGLDEFEDSVDHVIPDSQCGCSRLPIQEKVPLKRYDFGTDRCSKTKPGQCGIVTFLENSKDRHQEILEYLESIDTLTDELLKGIEFLKKVIENPERAKKEDPCLKVGDLIIALESAGIPDFYTLNYKESQHLCRVLEQTLIVCRKRGRDDPEDVVCEPENQDWSSLLE